MLKQTAATRVTDGAFAASRQLWLAGLGAAIVTREWARKDAGNAFRALVREGSSVEARALRRIGHRVESSIAMATTAWKQARDTAQATVNGLIESTTAALPRLGVPVKPKRAAKRAGKKTRPTAKRASRKSRRGKRSA